MTKLHSPALAPVELPTAILQRPAAPQAFHLGNFMFENATTGCFFQGPVSVHNIIFWSRYEAGSVTIQESGQPPVTADFGPQNYYTFTPQSADSSISWQVNLPSSFGYATVYANTA